MVACLYYVSYRELPNGEVIKSEEDGNVEIGLGGFDDKGR
jgi:hypothetical protein